MMRLRHISLVSVSFFDRWHLKTKIMMTLIILIVLVAIGGYLTTKWLGVFVFYFLGRVLFRLIIN
jgi:hypothetical protein